MAKPSFPSSLVVLAFSTPGSLALTSYIDVDAKTIIESVRPCHLTGDPDLYGLGVRVAFYISFVTSLFGVLFGLVDEMKAPRISFNILLLTLLVILIRNTLRGGFALFEWYIVLGLSLLPLPALLPIPPAVLLDEDKDEDEAAVKGCNKDGDREDTGILSRRQRQAREEEEQARELATEGQRAFLSDGIGIGFLLLLYGFLSLLFPWLYFQKARSGHKAGCAVPIVLFGTWDLYNTHWQRFLKAGAIMGILGGVIFVLLGILLVIASVLSWRIRAIALEILNKKRDKTDIILGLLAERKQPAGAQEASGADAARPVTAEGASSPRQLARELESARGRKLAESEDADRIFTKNDQRAKARAEKVREKWKACGIRAFLYAVAGGLSIWFLEKTLRLNHVDLGDEIGDSSGQMLALMVAVFTSVGFLYDVAKANLNERDLQGRTREAELRVRREAYTRRLRALEDAGRLGDAIVSTVSAATGYGREKAPADTGASVAGGESRSGTFLGIPRFSRQRIARRSNV